MYYLKLCMISSVEEVGAYLGLISGRGFMVDLAYLMWVWLSHLCNLPKPFSEHFINYNGLFCIHNKILHNTLARIVFLFG